MRLALAALLLAGCSTSVPPRPSAPAVSAVPPRVVPEGWQVVEFEHFSFTVPGDWTRFPPKDGKPPIYSDADGKNGVIGTSLESTDDREEIARKLVNESGDAWTDTVEGAPATYVTGTARAENITGLNATVVVFQDGKLRHYLICAHLGQAKMTGVCRQIFGSIRFVR